MLLIGGNFLARAPDLLYPTCPGWGASTIAVSYIKTALACLPLEALLLLLLSIFIVIYLYIDRRRRQKLKQSGNNWTLQSFRLLHFDDPMQSLRPLHFGDPKIMRKILSQGGDVIGMGGSGNVRRVRLHSHKDRQYQTVAVKELTRKRNNQAEEKQLDKLLDAEVKALGSVRHRNIITLLCCITGISTNLLVYEYMRHGSLDQWLHKPRGRLDWPSRVGISTDAARGLSYMHDQGIIHRDFGAKIDDFGLARLLAKPGESEPASAVCRTPGHIAPEYFRNAEVSEKVDVYSFGVVLLELITGQKPHNAGTEPGVGLARWASQQYMKKVRWEHIIDKDIQNPDFLEDTKSVFKLGLSCTSEHQLDRPTMNEVLQELLSCDPASRVNHRGKKRTLDVKVCRNIRDKIFRRGLSGRCPSNLSMTGVFVHTAMMRVHIGNVPALVVNRVINY